jgi:hypothetical protein
MAKHDHLTCQNEDHDVCLDAQLEASEYVAVGKVKACRNCGMAAIASQYGPMHVTKTGLKLDCYGSPQALIEEESL